MRGRFNSSITRVRPFFQALMDAHPSGEPWLAGLLGGAPRTEAIPADIRRNPGMLRPELAELGKYFDRVLGRTIPLARCFEKPAPPSQAFLRWLIENPERLRWPERRAGERVVYGIDTQRKREALVAGPDAARTEVQAEAMAELARLGPEGSRRKWWAFEGHTEVDCWLETDRLLLFVEGKRTEALSASTDWFPARNQLVRNLEVVGELAAGRVAAVLLVSEEPVADLTPADVAASDRFNAQLAQVCEELAHDRQASACEAVLDVVVELLALPGPIELEGDVRRSVAAQLDNHPPQRFTTAVPGGCVLTHALRVPGSSIVEA